MFSQGKLNFCSNFLISFVLYKINIVTDLYVINEVNYLLKNWIQAPTVTPSTDEKARLCIRYFVQISAKYNRCCQKILLYDPCFLLVPQKYCIKPTLILNPLIWMLILKTDRSWAVNVIPLEYLSRLNQ